jgi:cold shock CspA family protein
MASSKQSSTRHQDRTLFCTRCGVAFLWSAEEQAYAAATSPPNSAVPRTVRPSQCPGCRQLLPPPGRERGLVKWYNRRKRFGFITRKDQPDLFVHGSAVKDKKPLSPQQLVEFSVEESDRGLAAVELVRLDVAHAAEASSDDEA